MRKEIFPISRTILVLKNKENIFAMIFKYSFYFSLFIFYIFLFHKINDKLSKNKSTKVCLCTIGKKENLYIKEFIEYYFQYGVDKIFIYDNNSNNQERFQNVINKYIKNKFVSIINFRGKKKENKKPSPQNLAFRDCLKRNINKFDWIIFYDMDEYLYLKNFKNIKNYLNQKRFEKCDNILLNFVYYSDNNLLYYDNRTLSKRFFTQRKIIRGEINYEIFKSILKVKKYLRVNSIHLISKNLTFCNGFGQIKNYSSLNYDFDKFYIKHFFSKSVEEFINKLLKGSAVYGNSVDKLMYRIKEYFDINEKTINKINYIRKKINLNLSQI